MLQAFFMRTNSSLDLVSLNCPINCGSVCTSRLVAFTFWIAFMAISLSSASMKAFTLGLSSPLGSKRVILYKACFLDLRSRSVLVITCCICNRLPLKSAAIPALALKFSFKSKRSASSLGLSLTSFLKSKKRTFSNLSKLTLYS